MGMGVCGFGVGLGEFLTLARLLLMLLDVGLRLGASGPLLAMYLYSLTGC